MRLSKNFVYRDSPAGDGRLGVRDLAAPEHGRLSRFARAVGPNSFRDRIDVPNDMGAGGEVIGALVGLLGLCGRA